MSYDPETREEAIDLWNDYHFNGGCSCHCGNPPCDWCVRGYGLDLEEYLANLGFDSEDDETEDLISAHDRAMKVL